MEPNEIYTLARENPHCFLATVDQEGRPRVRGIHLYRIDEQGLIFHTGVPKALYRQLKSHDVVEICFVRHAPFTQVRISGSVAEFAR